VLASHGEAGALFVEPPHAAVCDGNLVRSGAQFASSGDEVFCRSWGFVESLTCFDDCRPDVGIAGFRDRIPPLPPSGAVLDNIESGIRRQLPGVPEAVDITDFGDQLECKHSADSPEATQGCYFLFVAVLGGEVR